MKYTITNTFEPKSYQGKNGEFKMFSIKTKETGNDYISGYYNKTTSQWKVGDIVEFTVVSKEKDGKTYKNFQLPDAKTINNDRLDNLEKRILDLEKKFDSKFANLEMDIRLEKTNKFLSDKELNRIKEDYKDTPASNDIPTVDNSDLPF